MGATQNAMAIVRVGFVSSTDPDTATVRVKFPDLDGVVSYHLQVLQFNTLKNNDYWLPDIDEQVACLFFGNGLESGIVLGSLHSKKDRPPVSSQDKRHSSFADGTWFEYDRGEHRARAHVEGRMDIYATGDINIKSGGKVYINGVQVRVNDPAPPANAAEKRDG